jgi:rod shape-determining protein MreD
MSALRVGIFLAFFFGLFAIQESAISLIHFPIAGFSLYLAIAIALMAHEDGNAAIITGFLAGFVLDLSPTSNGPFGQWALILTLVGYFFTANRESIADLTTSPITFVIFVTLGVSAALLTYILFGTLLGEHTGSLKRDFFIIFANAIWTMLFTPIFLPAVGKFRQLALSSKER